MKTVFNYNKFNDEARDTLVESFVALCDAVIEGKHNTSEFAELNKQFNEDFMKECVSAIPNVEYTGLDMLKNPMINSDICAKCF